RRMSDAGLRVLFVCFNSLLAGRVRLDMQRKGVKTVTAVNYHQLAVRLVKDSGRDLPINEDWEAFESWLQDAAVEIVANLPDSEKFDALVLDETQDLMTFAFMELLDCLVKGGLEN